MMETFLAFKERYENYNINITFFGGEPLLLFDEIVSFIETIDNSKELKQGITYNMITNGSLLDDKKIDFINKYFKNLTVSLDGTQSINDYYRRTINNNPTYNLVEKNLKKLKSRSNLDINYEVTLTDAYYNNYNAHQSKEIWNLFKNLKSNIIDFIPVYDDKRSFFSDENRAKIIVEELINLWLDDIYMLNKTFEVNCFKSNLLSILKPGRQKSCSAGKNYFAIDSNLNIYPCQTEKYKGNNVIGEIKDGNLELNKNNRQYVSKSNCKKCPCFNGCSCYCKVFYNNENLTDICKYNILVNELLRKKIQNIYLNNNLKDFKKKIIYYYGKSN